MLRQAKLDLVVRARPQVKALDPPQLRRRGRKVDQILRAKAGTRPLDGQRQEGLHVVGLYLDLRTDPRAFKEGHAQAASDVARAPHYKRAGGKGCEVALRQRVANRVRVDALLG